VRVTREEKVHVYQIKIDKGINLLNNIQLIFDGKETNFVQILLKKLALGSLSDQSLISFFFEMLVFLFNFTFFYIKKKENKNLQNLQF
jgi:hypothetical protein